MRKRRKWNFLAFALSGVFCLSALLGMSAHAAALEAETLVPVGHTIGIKLFAEGVIVIGLAEVESQDGVSTPGVDCGLQVGDVIEEANGQPVESSEQFSRMLQQGGSVTLGVSRDGRGLTLDARPVLGGDGAYRLGAWIRDSMAGIGTITFYDPSTGTFGALGHGITDTDTGLLMPLGDGSVMDATVKAVKPGGAGEPGELRGSFNLSRDVGELYANTDRGVFGVIESQDFTQADPVPVARSEDVKTGPAIIRANVSGDGVEEFSIKIVRVLEGADVQNLLLEVTDPRLLQLTGGIVQGMSGCPILQDGRLVGAVTHV